MLKDKRILMLLLVLMLVVSFTFTACSGETTEPADANEETNVVENEESDDNELETAAMNYFANMTSSNMMGAEEFVEKVLAGDVDSYILDIRRTEDYEEGHIKGAVNIPYGTDISDNLENIPNDKPLLVYCYSGQTASQTIALLNVAGFEAINITSGWNGAISQVEGFEEAVETQANELPEATTEIAEDIKEAIAKFYEGDTIHKISAEDTYTFVEEEDESVVLLDIRREEDYEEGHIDGAINLPYGKGMEEGFGSLPKDKTIVVICYSGQTADQTNAILHLLGFDALGMSGGMNGGWAKAELPVVND
jgi:rhodanese-related sulfurtransferase